jgi:hypothetical protein
MNQMNKETMSLQGNQDFTTTILVDQPSQKVFEAIQDFRAWWSEDIDGQTDNLHEVFSYRYKDIHLCKLRLIEKIQDKRLVYRVLDNQFSIFSKDKTEWINTKLVFDISREGGKTKITFTHIGLVPEYECYEVCNTAWTTYINSSLYNLIASGKGQPTPKGEDGINADVLRDLKLIN